MKLTPIKKNLNILTLPRGVEILFSYQTPVAGSDDSGPFQTMNWYSATTTRHINEYLARFGLNSKNARKVSQDYLEEWLESK
jgi:hypothetical protein